MVIRGGLRGNADGQLKLSWVTQTLTRVIKKQLQFDPKIAPKQ